MPIKAPQGLCVPASYLQSCQAVCAALTAAQPESKTALAAALARTHRRMERLEKEVHARIKTAGLEHARVAVSEHQAEFCRWLGLEAVASYSDGEATTPAELESLISRGKQAGVRFVIANLQEGRQVGEALAWQLGAKLVTFSNFPSMRDGESSFDALVWRNLNKLITVASVQP
jgi:ABC-type Zn uptake system ZnuABC Zn-binding protein ZnuA